MIEVHTATGSVYEFDKELTQVRWGYKSRPISGDDGWKKLNVVPRIEMGAPMVLFMPFGAGTTVRTTSTVTKVEENK